MLEYSKAAFKKILNDTKKLLYVCNVTMQSFIIIYLIYALCTHAGKLWANIPLLVLCAGYFVFFLVATKCNPLHKIDPSHKKFAKVVKYSKLFIKLCTLCVTLYGIYVATTHVTALSIILTTLSLLSWLLQVVFEVICILVEKIYTLLLDAVEADVEVIMKPVTTVKNFIKKATGKEVEPPKEKSKHRLWLDEQVRQTLAERKAQKDAKKQARKEAKANRKKQKKNAETPMIETKEIEANDTQNDTE